MYSDNDGPPASASSSCSRSATGRVLAWRAGLLEQRKDPDGAAAAYRQAAEAGHVEAAFNLARLLEQRKDPDGAAAAYRQAAAAGHVEAAFELGRLFEDSFPGVADRWYRQAAKAGHVEACYRLDSLRQRLHALLDDVRALRAENHQLRDQIAVLLGEQRAAAASPRAASRSIGPCS